MWGSRSPGSRGQSEVLGVALLFGLVLTVSVAAVLVGASAIGDRSDRVSLDQAERSMAQLDEEVTQLSAARGPGGEASFEGLSSGERVNVSRSGWLKVSVENSSTGQTFEKQITLGKVVYERDGRTVAYQGGGVWRGSSEGDSVPITEPNFEYRGGDDPSLTIPVVSIEGSIRDDDVSLEERNSTRLFPNQSIYDVTNPLGEDDEITITVKSDYYRGWGEFFEGEVGSSNVQYDHAKRSVEVSLEPSTGSSQTGTGALISSTGSTQLANDVEITSYDSSGSSSGPHPHGTGDVFVENLVANTRPTIDGNLTVKYAPDTVEANNGRTVVQGRAVFGETSSAAASPMKLNPGNDANRITFNDKFSTKSDLRVERDVDLGDDPTDHTVVGGSLTVHDSGQASPRFAGNVYVHGNGGSPNDGTYEVTIDDGTIDGDLIVDGDVRITNASVDVDGGHIWATGDVDVPASYTGVTVHEADGPTRTKLADHEPVDPTIPSFPPVDERIDDKIDEYEHPSNNDNGKLSPPNCNVNSNDELIFNGHDCTISEGNYHFKRLYLDGDDLTLDTSGGDVNITVDQDVWLTHRDSPTVHSTIEVIGNNDVRIYVGGATGSDDAFHLTNEEEIRTPGDTASQFKVFMKPSDSAELNREAEMDGVIWGPGPSGASTGTDISLHNDAVLHGTLVGHIEELNKRAEVHYDEALDDDDLVTGSDGPASGGVEFLHLESREVVVDD